MIADLFRLCEWYFCGNHLHRDEAGTFRSRFWRTVPQTGGLLCPEHSHLIDAERRVIIGRLGGLAEITPPRMEKP